MNNDLISRSELKKAFENLASDDYNEPIWYQQTVFETIDNAPTIPLPDFKEGYKQAIRDGKTNFSRPRGEWIGEHFVYKCSKCGHIADSVLSVTGRNIIPMLSNYCPECGADMREADNE